MISLVFRIVLILCSVFTFTYMVQKIRGEKLQIEHAIFWIMFAFLLIVISVFPELAIWGAKALGIYSSTNFIFLVILFIVILKLFSATLQISNLEYRIKELTQKIAIDDKISNEKEDKNEED